jgi:hypothetical protein
VFFKSRRAASLGRLCASNHAETINGRGLKPDQFSLTTVNALVLPD